MKREREMRARHPYIHRLLLAATNEPRSTAAWHKGAAGEQRVGAVLDKLIGTGAIVLHDRAIPGSRSNIDHIVVARSGVWIVDTKNYAGQVECRDFGGWRRTDLRLYVGGRNHTNLVAAMGKQVEAVRKAVDPSVPICSALCFTGAEWSWFPKPFAVNGVLVAWPDALCQAIATAGDAGVPVSDTGTHIAAQLPFKG